MDARVGHEVEERRAVDRLGLAEQIAERIVVLLVREAAEEGRSGLDVALGLPVYAAGLIRVRHVRVIVDRGAGAGSALEPPICSIFAVQPVIEIHKSAKAVVVLRIVRRCIGIVRLSGERRLRSRQTPAVCLEFGTRRHATSKGPTGGNGTAGSGTSGARVKRPGAVLSLG